MRKIDRNEKKMIREIITQGNNHEIQKLFNEIVKAYQIEFTEDNVPTMISFILKNIFNSFSINTTRTIDIDSLEIVLRDAVNEHLEDLKAKTEHIKLGDITFKKLNEICKEYRRCMECPIPYRKVCDIPPNFWDLDLEIDLYKSDQKKTSTPKIGTSE